VNLLKMTGYILSLLLMCSTVQAAETTDSQTTKVAEDVVDINTADAPTIARILNGIGEKKAAAIVQYREEHGPFKSVAELENVYGIGSKTIEKNLDQIVISEIAAEEETVETVEPPAASVAPETSPNEVDLGSME